jgi:membrane-associated phospholipid phosphatase
MQPRINRKRLLAAMTGWVIAIAIATVFDRDAAQWARRSGIELWLHHHSTVKEIFKAPGFFPFTLCVAVLVAALHRHHLRAGLFLIVAAIPAGLNQVSKWILGRTRPFTDIHGKVDELTPFTFHPLPGFTAKNLSFPSGHAALAFATAAALSILIPRWRWAFYVLAACVAAERVLENAHWLSDAVAAAALGVGGAWVVRALWWNQHKGNDQHGLPVSVAGDSGV